MPRKREKIFEIDQQERVKRKQDKQSAHDDKELSRLKSYLINPNKPDREKALSCIAAISGFNLKQSCGYEVSLIGVLARTRDTEILSAAFEKFPAEEKLYAAAAMGLASKLAKLIPQADDINTPLPSGETALYLAAKYGQVLAAELLLNAGAAANPKTELYDLIAEDNALFLEARMNAGVNPHVVSPLYAATRGRHHEMMRLLATRGADIHRLSPYGAALQGGAFRCVAELLIQIKPDEMINLYTAMHVAAFNNDTTALGILVDHGAAIDCAPSFEVQDRNWFILCPPKRVHYASTPLNCAAAAGSYQAAEYLLKAKANVHHLACDILPWRYDGIVRDEGIGMMPIHNAATSGKGEVVGLLLNHGAFINYRTRATCYNSYYDIGWSSPFEISFYSMNHSAATMLVNRGAHIDDWAYYMKHATLRKDVVMMSLLLEYRNKKQKDLSGYLHIAVQKGHIPSVELLIKNGALVTNDLLTLARGCKYDDLAKILEDAIRKQPIPVSQSVMSRFRSIFKSSPPNYADDDNDPLPSARV